MPWHTFTIFRQWSRIWQDGDSVVSEHELAVLRSCINVLLNWCDEIVCYFQLWKHNICSGLRVMCVHCSRRKLKLKLNSKPLLIKHQTSCTHHSNFIVGLQEYSARCVRAATPIHCVPVTWLAWGQWLMLYTMGLENVCRFHSSLQCTHGPRVINANHTEEGVIFLMRPANETTLYYDYNAVSH